MVKRPQISPVRPPSDEVEYQRYLLEKIQRGKERARIEAIITQSHVEKRMPRWMGN
jgi:hypothetical protein